MYASPEFISTLSTSTPIARHVLVDYELRGCPINKLQLVEVLSALLNHRKPNIPNHSVCEECKRAGVVCVTVARGEPCLGPITQAGCGAICPTYHRGCYGCFGPKEACNAASLTDMWRSTLDVSRDDVIRSLRTYNAAAPAFQKESQRHE